ncbi:MAG: DUF2953 domain-containing protein [Epulopiscium sp.]|nr:DUF2953 domain-containing protein [Candidatus Epulonipiscium sp.]
MMSILSVLLLILKYTGIILGIILLILLSILVIILFVPVRYSFYLSGNKNIDMDVKVTWFRKILYYHYRIQNSKKTTQVLYFFGKSLLQEEKVEEEEPQNDTVREEFTSIEGKIKDPLPKFEEKKNTYIKYTKTSASYGIENKSKKIIEHHKKEAPSIQNIKDTAKDLGEEVEEQVDEKDSFGIKALLNYPDKSEVLSYTYTFLKKLILHIKPRKFYGEVEFGLDDPSHTGYVLAGIGIMQPYFGNSVTIKANFEKKIFLGEISGIGRFSIGIIIKYIIEYLLKKPIKQILTLYLKKRKEDKNGIEFEE